MHAAATGSPPSGLHARAQVTHELSVPAVSTILLSMLAWAVAAATRMLLGDALAGAPQAGLQGAAAAGALVAAVVVCCRSAAEANLAQRMQPIASAAWGLPYTSP